MTATVLNDARKELSGLELSRLEQDFRKWMAHRRSQDGHGRQETQLDAVQSLIDGGIRGLAGALPDLRTDRPEPDVYDDCRMFDLRTVWLRRVWLFFRHKFDQRDDPDIGRILEAADNVVWSCHRQVFEQAELRGLAVTRRPAPLPYIEAQYSPEAFPAELVPRDLKGDVDVGFLRDHLNRLPISLVRLPPACVHAPWWLVYVGHEVGHHVHYALVDGMMLVSLFRDRVGEVVGGHGGDENDVARWGRWSSEIFADVFSVVAMGQWAVWAIADLELTRTEGMLTRRNDYPSPAVRLRLLAEVASRLGLDAGRGPGSVSSGESTRADRDASRDASMVPFVVSAALDDLPDVGLPLPTLGSFRRDDFVARGPVDRWADDLLGGPRKLATPGVRSSRLVASASMAAWARLTDVASPEERAKRRADLTARTMDTINDNADPDSRPAEASAPDLGPGLADLLLRATPSDLAS